MAGEIFLKFNEKCYFFKLFKINLFHLMLFQHFKIAKNFFLSSILNKGISIKIGNKNKLKKIYILILHY